jgi:uncharacterized protein
LKKLYVLTLVLAIATTGAASGQSDTPAQGPGFAGGRITVTGTGHVQAPPDMAEISLGVTTQAQSASEALASNNAAMAAVFARLEQAGIAPRDMQTAQLNVMPNWAHSSGEAPPVITSYTAQNMLNVTLRNIDSLGLVLDAAVQDGANTLHGISFGQTEPPHAAARGLAVQDARARAETIAAAANVRLGKIIDISEGNFEAAPSMMRLGAVQDSAVPLAGGEVAISAQVRMVFEIIE